MRLRLGVSAAAVALGIAAPAHAGAVPLDVGGFRVVERDSGPVNYVSRLVENGVPFLRASYRPPLKTVVLGHPIPEPDRASARVLRWSWRAIKLPSGGNECEKGHEDSAAVVYVTWKRTLRWYSIKYVWSSVGRRGAICDSRRNPFVAQDTVILESGAPLGQWKDEVVDLKAAFRQHFEGGDRSAEVPDFVGVGIMSDGDQTQSESVADYARFSIER